MHHIRHWAHNAAHESKYNPWHATSATAKPPDQVLTNTKSPSPLALGPSTNPDQNSGSNVVAEPDKDTTKIPISRRVWLNVKRALFRSWVNILLVFVPAGIAVHFAGINPNVVFALNAIAIIPLAGLLTFATESVAHRLGPTLGALLNVSFGNAVELIIFIALVKNEIRIVQASLVGSILANLLLILGMAFLIGGLQYREQVYDSTVTQMSACLLALSVLSLLIPTAFHASFNDTGLADAAVLKVSRGVSVILLLTYVLYLLFQLKSHSYLYQGVPQHIIDEQSQPGVLARFDSSSSSSASISSGASTRSSSSSQGSHRQVRKRIRAKLGMKRRTKVEFAEEQPEQIELDEKGQDPYAIHAKSSSAPDRPTSASDTHLTKHNAARTEERDQVGYMPAPAGIGASNSLPVQLPSTNQQQVSMPNTGSTNEGNSAAMSPRPTNALRAFSSFRAPPVFRASTNPQQLPNSRPLPPYQLRRMRSEPNAPRNPNMPAPASGSMAPQTKTEKDVTDEPPLSQTASIILLLCSTGLVALCAEFLVGSIEHLVESSPLSEAFIGLIILPIVGNAAEHVTAVTVAAKNKLDLALGVSLGSSIQIALFVTPVVVILGWILDKTMSLYFNLFEVASLFVSTFIVNFLVLDGRSNYLEGALLCACYIILAVAAYFFPDGQNQSALAGGSGQGGS